MRVLLATEGESDQVVAQVLIRKANPEAEIVPKSFPARGIQVVLRLLPDTVRAAHFGFFDCCWFTSISTILWRLLSRVSKPASAGKLWTRQLGKPWPR